MNGIKKVLLCVLVAVLCLFLLPGSLQAQDNSLAFASLSPSPSLDAFFPASADVSDDLLPSQDIAVEEDVNAYIVPIAFPLRRQTCNGPDCQLQQKHVPVQKPQPVQKLEAIQVAEPGLFRGLLRRPLLRGGLFCRGGGCG